MASMLDVIFARSIGVRIYGLGAVVLGLTGLFWGDFAVVWQPRNSAPGQSPWGYAVAVLPLLAGLAMQWRRATWLSALTLTVLYCLAVIFLDVPGGIAQPSVFVAWFGVAESLALAAGALLIYAYTAQLEPATAERLSKIGRLRLWQLSHLFWLGSPLLPCLHGQDGSCVAAARSTFLGVRDRGGTYCSRRRHSFRCLRAGGLNAPDGDVRRFRYPSACAADPHRPPHSYALGRERGQHCLDRFCVGHRGVDQRGW